MAILIDEKSRVIVQGITGQQGAYYAKKMMEYGTKIIAGVTPGRGGQVVHGLPVFNTVEEAVENCGPIDASITFVPAPAIKQTCLEAIDAGVKLTVLMVDGVPQHDALEIVTHARTKGARIIGPNSPGLISPGKAMLGALATQHFHPGPVLVLSRSGGMLSTLAFDLMKYGLGQSSCVGVGGDPVIGSDLPELALLGEEDEETKVIAIYSEIGSSQDERLAELIKQGRITKPVVVYIAGSSAAPGVKFSHAGAIVRGELGTAKSKITALTQAGAFVVDSYPELKSRIKTLLDTKA